MLETARIPATACHGCGRTMSATTGTKDGERPEPDCISVCGYCGALAVFTLDLSLRPMTEAEEAELMAGPVGARVLYLRSAIRRRKGGK